MPFVDVVGSIGAVAPVQIGFTAANVGVMLELTVTSNVVVVAHCPAAGVNVYVPDDVLLTVAGLHIPVTPFVDVAGSIGAVDPVQIGFTAAKVGMMLELTVTSNVVVAAHCPAVGVNI
jgi:hypothetical protein